MEQEDVAWLCAPFPHDRPITQTGAVIGLENPREAGFLPGAEIVGRVHMQDTAAFVRLGLTAGFDLDGLSDLASHAVRVAHDEIALVFGAGLEIENRTGETVRDSVVEVLAAAVNIFATDADERKRVAPL